MPPLFHRVYGKALASLPPSIVKVHDIGAGRTWRGAATVATGASILARAVRAVVGLPSAGHNVALSVEMTPNGDGETWRRRFGEFPLDTRVRPGRAPGTVEETLGPVTVTLRLVPDRTGVQQIPEGYRLLGVSLPEVLWPELGVRESAEGGIYRFKVVMRLWGVLIQSYEGWLETTDGT